MVFEGHVNHVKENLCNKSQLDTFLAVKLYLNTYIMVWDEEYQLLFQLQPREKAVRYKSGKEKQQKQETLKL